MFYLVLIHSLFCIDVFLPFLSVLFDVDLLHLDSISTVRFSSVLFGVDAIYSVLICTVQR